MTESTDAPEAVSVPRRIDYVPLDSLKADPRNPKSHDLSTIDSSYDRFGVVDVVTVDARTGFIISGHGRTTALREAFSRGDKAPEGVMEDEETGAWLVPVNSGWSSKNDAEAAAALIAMNRLTELGGWVDESLLTLLDEISASGSGFEGVGFSETDMDDLKHLLEDVPDLDELANEYDPDAVPNSGGAAGVTIKITDAGAIDAWHSLRDTVKTDDEALRIALGLDKAPVKPKGKKPTSRATDATADDIETGNSALDAEAEAFEGPDSPQVETAVDNPLTDTRIVGALHGDAAPEGLPDDGLDWSTAATVAPSEAEAEEVEEELAALDVEIDLTDISDDDLR